MEAKREKTSANVCACAVGYYEVISPDNPNVRICSPCHETCFSCTGYQVCTGCKISDNREINTVTKRCICKDGFYEVRTGNTVLPACQPCSVADNKIVSQDKFSCICKPGFYMNSSGKCNSCPPSCSECDSYSNCTACDAANFRELKAGACIPMQGYYESGKPSSDKCNSECKNCETSATNCTSCRTEDGYVMTENKKSCVCKDNYKELEDIESGIKVCRSPENLAQETSSDGNVMWFYIFLSISAILAMIIIIYIARRTCFKSNSGPVRVHIFDQTNQDIFNQRVDDSNIIGEENASNIHQQQQQAEDFGIIPEKKNKSQVHSKRDFKNKEDIL